MPVSNWSTTAASNGSTLGIDIAENCAAANINNALREMMAQLKTKLDAIDSSIGSGSFQPLDATLTALAALAFSANEIAYATGSDAFAKTTLSAFARTLLDDGDAATARTTLGAIGSPASSLGSGSSGYVKLDIGGTTFILQWVDYTVGGNSTASVTYPTAFSSWSKAWVNGGENNTSATNSVLHVSATTTTGATVFSGFDASVSGTLFAIGV